MWVNCLKTSGFHTVTISPFAARHSLYHFLAGFKEVFDTGYYGEDIADQVTPHALEWLDNNGKKDDWFLHVNYWDVHVPYRMPDTYRVPFDSEPQIEWLNDDLFLQYVEKPGFRSYHDTFLARNITQETRLQPPRVSNIEQMKQVYNGYDNAVSYVDHHIGKILEKLEELHIVENTAIIITADHGEDLGELGSIGHGFATQHTARIPFILHWPAVPNISTARVDRGLHYHFDIAATILELLGIEVPEIWDGKSFASALQKGAQSGRDSLIVSNIAQACQRSVRFAKNGNDFLYSKTRFDLYHNLPEDLLFNLSEDPFTIKNVSTDSHELVELAQKLLEQWLADMKGSFPYYDDPLKTVLEDGIKFKSMSTIDTYEDYMEHLAKTGRKYTR